MTDINGAKISILINQLSLLVDADASRVSMAVSYDGDWLSLYVPEIDTKPYPADIITFGEKLGFTYFEHDSAEDDSSENYTHFAWLV